MSEITRLLGERGNQDGDRLGYGTASSWQDSDAHSNGLEQIEDEAMKEFMPYELPGGGSLGLSGGMGVFGTSLSRRGSILAAYPPASASRRPSRPTIQHPVAEQPKLDLSNAIPEDLESSKTPSKYLYGVSNAQFWPGFFGIALACFVTCFDSTLMASSHPVITSYFDASNSAAWLSTSFLLASTAFQPMLGRLSDTVGRKIPFVVSLITFLLGTLWCALAQSILQFILARAICGLGAAGALTLGTIITSDLVPPESRGGYLSLLGLGSGIGSSLGAALGGFLAETLGWRWEFGIQVPAIALCVAVAYFCTPPKLGPMLCETSTESHTFIDTLLSFDLAGSALLASSVTFLILALNLGGNMLPWDHWFIIMSFVMFLVLGVALVHVEHRAVKPVIPLHVLFSKPQGHMIFGNFLACMTMNTIFFNLPLYFQAVLLDTPTRSGTRLIIPFLANLITSFITGNYINYSLRFRPTLLLGSLLMVIGSIGLTVMPRTLPSLVYAWLAALTTGGQGFTFPTISIAILASSPPNEMAVATSTLILFKSLGTIMGVAVSSLVTQNGLKYFLEINVTGPQKLQVIQEVIMSVEVIRGLEETVREQGKHSVHRRDKPMGHY